MNRLVSSALCGALALGGAACGAAGTDSEAARGLVTADDSSRADTLVVLVTVRVGLPEGAYLEPSHVVSLELWVDGQPWAYVSASDVLEGETGRANAAGWRTTDAPCSALFVASVGAGLAQRHEDLETAGDWASLLDLQLAPGGHVAELRTLVLANGEDRRTVEVGILTPFTLLEGFRSAFLGEHEVEVRDLGSTS